jgi:hypothetical protein
MNTPKESFATTNTAALSAAYLILRRTVVWLVPLALFLTELSLVLGLQVLRLLRWDAENN